MTGFSLFGLWTLYAMKTLNVNGPVYQRIVQGKDLIADILPPPEYIIESYLVALQLSNTSNPKAQYALLNRFQALEAEYQTRHEFWQQQQLEPELAKPLLDQSFTAAQLFYNEAKQHFIPSLQSNATADMHASLNVMQAAYETHRAAIDEVVKLSSERNKVDEHNAAQQIQFNALGLSSVFVLSLLLALILTWLISKSIIKQLGGEPGYASEVVFKIASGKLDNQILVAQDDKTSLLANMADMQLQLRERIEQEAREKANALRIQLALDKANSNVMMTDENYNIIYINDALASMFQLAETDLRSELPIFNARNLLGTNIDVFHKNPSYQRGLLDNMQTMLKTSFIIGGRHLDLIANPVVDEKGMRVGTVVEWQDRTHEIQIEDEIKTIVDAVKSGQLNNRLNTEDKNGFLQTLSININDLTTVIENVFYDIAETMQTMAAGDLSTHISHEYSGVYDSCKNDINTTLQKLREVFEQIQISAAFISHSSDEIANGNNNLSQRAEQQASSLQLTASSMEELTSTVKNNADSARQANQVALVTRNLAENGGAVVEAAINAMQEINESSNRIADIIGVIDEIAFQTNLLALNASVEAARAGENGRGFSVVATEVRNLAQRSANAARESKTLIQNSIQKVRTGTGFVNDTGKSLHEIVDGVKEVSSIIAHIASASEQQYAGIEQVNQAVAQMDSITQQNASLAEQAAAASVSMNEQTIHMTHLLGFFKLQSSEQSENVVQNPTYERIAKAPPPPKMKANTEANSAINDSAWDEF